MDIFETLRNEKFFSPLTGINKRIYFECITELIEYSKSIPVLYETNVRDLLELCEQTNHSFDLFHMSENDLKNTNYSSCLKSLSEYDIKRLNSLKTIDKYSYCITYMIKFNKKLEQEIISYYLNK